MPFAIVRNDITQMDVDAIVNTANPRVRVGSGVDSMIHEKAGPELLEARRKIGNIARGNAAITAGYRLRAKFVIHTVGPVWYGGLTGEQTLLRSCYDKSLKLAVENGCRSVAFPLISTGNYGFPKDKALQIAISAFSEFLLEHELMIYLVVFDSDSLRLSEKLFQNVASYIDDHYVEEWGEPWRVSQNNRSTARRNLDRYESAQLRRCSPCAPAPEAMSDIEEKALPKPISLEEKLKQADAGFAETLLKLIDKTGRKDSDIYKRANLSKQHFSKIRNNPDYKPTKPTAIALALALELDLDATKDLIGRAGYALTNSSKFDLIIQYFIEQGKYNVVEINTALYDFDQRLLGGGGDG